MIKSVKSRLLAMSRKVPGRQCSPYGHWMNDDPEIKRIARAGYERILKLEGKLNEMALAKDDGK